MHENRFRFFHVDLPQIPNGS